MSQLIPFQFEAHSIPVHVDDEGNPWWYAKDVCIVLGIHNVSNAVGRLKSNEKSALRETDNPLIINEKGLYRLIMRSNKPEAERFQDWVFGEVLPQIRKTGKYEPSPTLPQLRDPRMQMLLEAVVRMDSLEARLEDERQTRIHEREEILRQTIATQDLAIRALESQMYMTLRQYRFVHHLEHQLPDPVLKRFATYLTGYCLDHGIPISAEPVADRIWGKENRYHVDTINMVLPGWLGRENGQLGLDA